MAAALRPFTKLSLIDLRVFDLESFCRPVCQVLLPRQLDGPGRGDLDGEVEEPRAEVGQERRRHLLVGDGVGHLAVLDQGRHTAQLVHL